MGLHSPQPHPLPQCCPSGAVGVTGSRRCSPTPCPALCSKLPERPESSTTHSRASTRSGRARREEWLGTRKLPCHPERCTACLLQASRRAGGVSHRQAGFPALHRAARQAGAARRTAAPAVTAGPSGAPGAGGARGWPPARWPHGARRHRNAPRGVPGPTTVLPVPSPATAAEDHTDRRGVCGTNRR